METILRHGIRAMVLAGLLFCSVSAVADIYKYEDRNGKLHFTDRPMKGSGYRLLWHSPTRQKKSTGSRIDIASSERNRHLYSPMIEEIAKKVRLKAALLHAVIKAESAYDPRALSRTGAKGLMQLMPDTAKRYGVYDSWDPRSNLTGGATYLRDLLIMFNNDLRLALAAYNAGENAVKRFGNSIPPYPETEAYVVRVLDLYRENQSSGQFAALE
ncbi:lytic transglycosylase domain-containing protein [Sedimenticola selenatireducens]|uniref:lytic transglycosylase domain-containing protein n=2 Tax=Sedimenticola TaxID=349742 RepID=UPI00048EF9A4|nr:lytic transglycosylase domain-containing protein [Sedimenticola selenatireducens]